MFMQCAQIMSKSARRLSTEAGGPFLEHLHRPLAAEKQIFGVNHRLLQTDVYRAKFSQPSEYLAETKLTA